MKKILLSVFIILIFCSAFSEEVINIKQIDKILSLLVESIMLEKENKTIKSKKVYDEAIKILKDEFKKGKIYQNPPNCPFIRDEITNSFIASCVESNQEYRLNPFHPNVDIGYSFIFVFASINDKQEYGIDANSVTIDNIIEKYQELKSNDYLRGETGGTFSGKIKIINIKQNNNKNYQSYNIDVRNNSVLVTVFCKLIDFK